MGTLCLRYYSREIAEPKRKNYDNIEEKLRKTGVSQMISVENYQETNNSISKF